MERLFPKFSLCFWIIQLRRAFSHRRGFWPYSFGLWIGLEAELFSVGRPRMEGMGHSIQAPIRPILTSCAPPIHFPHTHVIIVHMFGIPTLPASALCSAIKRINWWKVFLLNSVLLLFYAFVGFPNCFSSDKSYPCQIPFSCSFMEEEFRKYAICHP